MKERTRMVLVGGFLGAGKTTLINKLAQHFLAAGVPIGVVTNDQGQMLVDTEFVKMRGLDVEEVPGGCFCCNFQKLIDGAESLVDRVRPQYILAEPVGSCTDLIATVAAPLKAYHGDSYSTAPLMVLVDGLRIMAEPLATSGKGGYLRNHQLEEAELLVLSKTDQMGVDDIVQVEAILRGINPEARIIRYSAVSGEGMEQILLHIESEEETNRQPVDVDYDIYADAEAELGWYNGVFEFQSPEYDSYTLSMDILRRLSEKYPSQAIAHAKVALTSESNHTKVSLVGNELSVGGVFGSRYGKGPSKLNFNARVVSQPGDLRDAARASVQESLLQIGQEHLLVTDACFSPGRPNPTFRLT
ncbi:MAG: GTP-binding protein [Candidatus Methanomethylophilaceae archaeon]|nr:GTP-binding protein [Candidatus Methanomethylophilaceae archaeon]